MPRYRNPPPPKPDHLVAAEKIGADALRRYCRREIGVAADLSRETGIAPPVLSRMSTNKSPISIEQAMRLAVATKGELQAPVLCPSGAELLAQYVEVHREAVTA